MLLNNFAPLCSDLSQMYVSMKLVYLLGSDHAAYLPSEHLLYI